MIPQLSRHPMFQANPFLTQWLGAAEQATAVMVEMNRQALRFWTGWMPRTVTAPAAAEAAPTPATTAAVPSRPTPALAPMAEPVALAAAPATEPEVPPAAVPAVPLPVPSVADEAPRKKPGKGAVQLRTAVARRKGAAAPAAKPTGRRITRH